MADQLPTDDVYRTRRLMTANELWTIRRKLQVFDLAHVFGKRRYLGNTPDIIIAHGMLLAAQAAIDAAIHCLAPEEEKAQPDDE
jgi:hypothetical protein